MMNNFVIQFNYQSRYWVVIDGTVYVYKLETYNFDQPFLSFQPKNGFIGKPKVCKRSNFSGAYDNANFDGNTILLDCQDNEYVFISGREIIKFQTDDMFIDYISLMGNNMSPYTFAIGEKYTYFSSVHHKVIENDEFEEGTLLNATNDSLDLFDYHLGKCGADFCKTSEHSLIHTFYTNDEEDEEDEDDVLEEEDEDEVLVEKNCCNGSNEVVRIFNQRCVILYEKDSIYAFGHCVHQSICEDCYKKGDIDKLKCFVCRT